MTDERPSPTAWPYRWRDLPGYPALYEKLHFQYGQQRTAAIVAGEDDATNRDLASWRRLGQR